MLKFFKTIRQRNFKKDKLGKYLLYALGEIILITIGVLLAIQANNYNETRKTEKKRSNVYSRVNSDVERNIQSAKQFLAEYQEMEYLYQRILNDSIDAFLLNEGLGFLITGIIFYEYDKIGIEQLKSLNLRDEKVVELIEIYESANLHFSAYTKTIEANVEDNLIYWRDHYPWFKDYVNDRINEQAKDYFLNSQDYKNKVAYFYLSVYQGYIPSVEAFMLALKQWKSKYNAL